MFRSKIKLLQHFYKSSTLKKIVHNYISRNLYTAKVLFKISKTSKCNRISNDNSENVLKVYNEKNLLTFPYVWLRDNCQCVQCFHPDSRSRIIDWQNFDIDVKPKEATVENDIVYIKWTDNHISPYKISWLKERSFRKEDRIEYTQNTYQLPKIEWSKNNFANVFRCFDYDRIIRYDSDLKEWLRQMCVYGVALIRDVSPDTDSCRKLANRVDFIKKTHYGEEFIVKAKPGTTNVAYLSSNLQVHTDLPYYEYKPGVNILHCLTQTASEGGKNLLCDGLYVAKRLKQINTKHYNKLISTPVEWEDVGEEKGNKFHSLYRSPLIQEDSNGNILRINYSTPQRGSHMDVEVEEVRPWYEALKSFVDLVHEESAEYKMNEGEILCFDNRRLLHGRTKYMDSSNNKRYIIGVYLDWDYIYSRFRILNK